MGSGIPVIDLSIENLKPGTKAWLLACKQVQCALEEYGCFEAIYHKVPLELQKALFSELEDLFDLPSETKRQVTSDRPYHSYIGQHSFIPLYESLGVDNATTLEGAQSFTRFMWPAGNDRFCESAHSFSNLVAEFERMVTRMVFDIYGAQRLYDSHMASTRYLLRCIKYRTPQMNQTSLGLNAHSDKTFTSILHQNQVNGLQIKAKDGQWIDVELSPSSFLFMAGDSLMAWSNDRIRPCFHQVVMKGNKPRYCLGLFTYNTGILQVPKELVDDKHPLLYKPYDQYAFLRFFRTEEGMKSECPIKTYCGV